MSVNWMTVPGVLVKGYGVASGGHDARFPGGTIRAQTPHFRARGVDLSTCFPGTLNISIAPRKWRLIQPRHTLADVTWWSGVPAETFSFSRCRVVAGGKVIHGWIYFPHPETKTEHHHPPTTVEVIARFIEGLSYGSPVELHLDPSEVEID